MLDNFIESIAGHNLFGPNTELGASGARQEPELRRLPRSALLRPRRRTETSEVEVVDGVVVVDGQRQGNVAENLRALSCAVLSHHLCLFLYIKRNLLVFGSVVIMFDVGTIFVSNGVPMSTQQPFW